MIISRNFLSEFCPKIKDLTIEQISSALFKSGIEVESWEKINAPSGLYYGEIHHVEKVLNSEKLKLCKVFVPLKNEIFQIICGANNVRQGLKVVVALPGAKLLNGELIIEERFFKSVQNIRSQGMICAYSELYKSRILTKIKDFEKGKIIELSNDWEINKGFKAEDFWLDDWIFDLSIPANRGDLHSAWGLSRELAKHLSIPPKELMHGCIFRGIQDSWFLKKMLLMNNFHELESFSRNLNLYAFVAFNEDAEGNLNGVRKKSTYFKKLLNAWFEQKPLKEFSMKKILVNKGDILNSMQLDVNASINGDFFCIENDYALVPEWRDDISSERDVAEEMLSIVGWDAINSDPVLGNIQKLNSNEMFLTIEKIRDFWRNYGFYECNTFNLHAKIPEEISVSNPLSNDHVSLRLHAVNELMNVIVRNYHDKRDVYPIFEIFERQAETNEWVLNVVVPENKSWFPLNDTRISFDLYDLQALLKKSFNLLNRTLSFTRSYKRNFPFLEINHMNVSDLGCMGYLPSSIPLKMWGFYCKIPDPVSRARRINSPSKYPPSYKDVSLEISSSSDISISEIINCFKSKDLNSVKLIEKYESGDFCSYLFRVKLNSSDHTLRGDEINKNIDELYNSLSCLKGVRIR